ncbi:MAG: zf-HC2 domain-containing protein [Actinomycetota bacterium]
MTESRDRRKGHPEELLAGYVDDSASPEERGAVEAHLADCSQCRDEVALATSARASLMRLPELEAPGLAARGVAGLREGAAERMTAPAGDGAGDEIAARREAKQENARGLRQWRISWAALAGAAAILAVLAVVPIVLSRGGGDMTAGSGPRLESTGAPADLADRYPPVFDLGSDYDQESMRALARRLGDQARRAPGTEDTVPGALRGQFGGASAKLADVSATDAVQCVLQGTGLPPETIPVYLEVAEYQGTPAYVAIVLSQGSGRDHLRVYTVSQEGCTFLFLADQPF